MIIERAFFDFDYQLIRDRHKMHARSISADTTNPANPHIEPLFSTIDITSADSLSFLYDLQTQRIFAHHMVGLIKVKAGSMIFGLQFRSSKPVEQPATHTGYDVFHHNPESFDRYWQEVGSCDWQQKAGRCKSWGDF